jgi:hypothetical protein
MDSLHSKMIFYLYYLRRVDKEDPKEPENWCPFYVGKGSNGRLYEHRKEAKKLLTNPNGKNTNPIRNNIIHKLWNQEIDYIEEIAFDNLTEQEAFEIEIEAIAAYGRIDLGTGCLANVTPGGDNPPRRTKENMTEVQYQRLCESMSGENNPFHGKTHTEAHKLRQAKIRLKREQKLAEEIISSEEE